MAKATLKKSTRAAPKPRLAKPPARKIFAAKPKRRSIAEINRWMTAHHDELLDAARKNCIRLTGHPTFGGKRARKSA